MIKRIKKISCLDNYRLLVLFDDGKEVIYDMAEDIANLPGYRLLEQVHGLFEQVQLDESRTVIYWNDEIDLPSDTLYEYGIDVTQAESSLPS